MYICILCTLCKFAYACVYAYAVKSTCISPYSNFIYLIQKVEISKRRFELKIYDYIISIIDDGRSIASDKYSLLPEPCPQAFFYPLTHLEFP